MIQTPVGKLVELSYHKGYYLDEAQQLFSHWRVILGERLDKKTGKPVSYIAKMVETEERNYIEPYEGKSRGKKTMKYEIPHSRQWRTISKTAILTEGADGPRPIHVATHLDGDTENFQPSNLKWLLLDEHRKVMRGEIVKKGKLLARQIKAIKKRADKGEKKANLAREYGVSRARISQLTKPKGEKP